MQESYCISVYSFDSISGEFAYEVYFSLSLIVLSLSASEQSYNLLIMVILIASFQCYDFLLLPFCEISLADTSIINWKASSISQFRMLWSVCFKWLCNSQFNERLVCVVVSGCWCFSLLFSLLILKSSWLMNVAKCLYGIIL